MGAGNWDSCGSEGNCHEYRLEDRRGHSHLPYRRNSTEIGFVSFRGEHPRLRKEIHSGAIYPKWERNGYQGNLGVEIEKY